jgi:cell wall-associated NlpC family hydrolase
VAVKRSERVVNHATSFIGTRYKYGGTTKKGMDCSGLVYTSFMKESIPLPRISRDMARSGSRISLKEVDKGDLVFFKTGKNRGDINHVGLVVGTDNNEILFIHSTTSKGVIISSMNETYWRNSFVEVRRVI